MKHLRFALTSISLLFGTPALQAGSSTWNLNPVSGDWNTVANWTPATVPNDPEDVATLSASAITEVTFSAATQVNAIIFSAEASPFNLTNGGLFHPLTISGAGIINDSGITQYFVSDNYGAIFFSGSATAGSETVFTNRGSTASNPEAGITTFDGRANAGQGTFINNPAEVVGFHAGQMAFFERSNAANGTFICNGGTIAHAYAAFLYFYNGPTAGNGTFIVNGGTVRRGEGAYVNLFGDDAVTRAGTATFTINGGTVRGAYGGSMNFLRNSNAEDATIIINQGAGGGESGTVFFDDNSRGGRARIELFGDGKLDISSHDESGVTIGSLDGNGLALLGANNLSVGANNLSSEFAGEISQAGSLTKIGGGSLSLTGANTYSGGTTIRSGTLLANNSSGSATGPGPVTVEGGRLAGSGIIAGAVTIGTAAGEDAFLVPKSKKGLGGTLTIQSLLTLNPNATYKWRLDSNAADANEVVANGVTITGAQFSLSDLGSSVLAPGTVFVVISNTDADPIVGAFSNLADGATVTVGSNRFQADYEGGDGNDLTLTVL